MLELVAARGIDWLRSSGHTANDGLTTKTPEAGRVGRTAGTRAILGAATGHSGPALLAGG